jgi:hypothetical protein
MSFTKWIKQSVENYAPRVVLAPYMKWRYRQRDPAIQGSAADRFTRIYETNNWGDTDSRSGPGSNLRAAGRFIDAFPKLLNDHQVRTVIDVPCGDFNWMRRVDLGGRKYIGGDIVKELVEHNQANYASPDRSFVCIDLTKDQLPPGDLLLVRDCFIHLSFDMIHRALKNIRRSPIRSLLATIYPYKRRNWDIETGGFRPINLLRPPFNLPDPLEIIEEDGTEVPDQNYRRHLALWHVGDL